MFYMARSRWQTSSPLLREMALRLQEKVAASLTPARDGWTINRSRLQRFYAANSIESPVRFTAAAVLW